MSRVTYTPEMLDFLRTTYAKVGVRDVTAAFNAQFGTAKTYSQIKAALNNYQMRCGRITGSIMKGVYKSVTPEQDKFIRDTYVNIGVAELTELFNQQFGTEKTVAQIRAFVKNHGIKSGLNGQFQPGNDSWNKGMTGWCAGGRSIETQFKKGQETHNHRPVGSTRICSKDGYVMIKTAEPRTWRFLHVVVYEQAHGPIPEGHRIWFKDNDRTNCSLDNLMLITRAQGAVINKNKLGQLPASLKESAVILVDITMKRAQILKEGPKNEILSSQR